MSCMLVMMVWPKRKWGDHARTEEGHCDLLNIFEAKCKPLIVKLPVNI